MLQAHEYEVLMTLFPVTSNHDARRERDLALLALSRLLLGLCIVILNCRR